MPAGGTRGCSSSTEDAVGSYSCSYVEKDTQAQISIVKLGQLLRTQHSRINGKLEVVLRDHADRRALTLVYRPNLGTDGWCGQPTGAHVRGMQELAPSTGLGRAGEATDWQRLREVA